MSNNNNEYWLVANASTTSDFGPDFIGIWVDEDLRTTLRTLRHKMHAITTSVPGWGHLQWYTGRTVLMDMPSDEGDLAKLLEPMSHDHGGYAEAVLRIPGDVPLDAMVRACDACGDWTSEMSGIKISSVSPSVYATALIKHTDLRAASVAELWGHIVDEAESQQH